MEILIGMCVVLLVCLLLSLRYIIILMEDHDYLQKQNIELLEELIKIKESNSKHKKQQLNG